MSNSSLAIVRVMADKSNYTVGRSGRKIECIAIHHMAGVLSAEQCGAIFQKVGRNGSSNYGIGNDGKIGLYVDEANTSWCNSNWDSNCKSVTIETSNCEVGGDWKVSDAALNSLIKLVADIAKRNNITLIKGKTLVWHSMFTATACPGPYLLSKLDYIIEEANKINNTVSETKVQSSNSIEYRIHIKGGSWLPWVTGYNLNDAINGYAGIYGKEIDGIQVKNRTYQAHTINEKWWGEVSKVDGSANGYAGVLGRSIDGLRITNAKYRVHILGGGWLPWVTGYNLNDAINGYAGNLGQKIDGLQVQ